MRSITDGELRRDYWHIDFLRRLDGVTIVEMANQNRFGGTAEQPPMATVTGRIGCSSPIMVDAFAYLKSITRSTAMIQPPAMGSPLTRKSSAPLGAEPLAQPSCVGADATFPDCGLRIDRRSG